MKALVLDGSRPGEAAVEQVRDTLFEGLRQGGYEVDVRRMRDLDIRHCLGCFGCWVQTPGECLIDDPARGLSNVVRSA